jgi:hypothetical protein
MLFVGLVGHAAEHPIISRLIQLGAARGSLDAPPSWDVAKPAIVVISGKDQPGEACWPGLHLAIWRETLLFREWLRCHDENGMHTRP